MKTKVLIITIIVFAFIFMGWVLQQKDIVYQNNLSQFKNSAWSQRANMQTARGLHSVGTVNGKIYAVGGGGIHASDANPEMYVYDPVSDEAGD